MRTAWTLEDLYRSIGRGWVLLLSFAVGFSLLALLAFGLWPQKFEATAVMTVEPLTVSAGAGTGDGVNMETERVVATSSEVLVLAAKSLKAPTIDELADAVTVSVPKGSQVLEFTVAAGDPATSAKRANAIANAYSERRVANAEAVVADAIAFLSGRIAELEQQIAAAAPTSEQMQTLQAQIASLQDSQAALTSTTFYSGALISPAVAPASSTRPSLGVFVAGGLFIGLFLGSFAALVYGRRRLADMADQQASSPSGSAGPVSEKGRRAPAPSAAAHRPPTVKGAAWTSAQPLILTVDELSPESERDGLLVRRTPSRR